MKKIIFLFLCTALALLAFFIYDFLIVELNELPEGVFLSKYPSPNNKFIARAYLLDEGGATVRTAIRVEIDNGNEIKTIYWNYDESTVNILWLDNKTIMINGHQLNIFVDTYQWKKDPEWENNRGKY